MTVNLFETRGSSLFVHHCEVCNEPLDKESIFSTCAECNTSDDEEVEV